VLTARLPACLAAPAAIATAGLLALAVTGCSGTPPPAGHAVATVSRARCAVQSHDLVAAARPSGYTEFVTPGQTALPVQSQAGHPLSFAARYVCGRFEGLISNLALTGVYRRQNNARARHFGYALGRWPLVPLTGPIVAQQAHRVLEMYEGIYQFTSPSSAAAFLRAESGGSQSGVVAGLARRLAPHRLPVHPAGAAGTVVTERLLGPQSSTGEHAIYLGLRINDFAVTLSFQGGQALTWHDVTTYWDTARSQLTAIDHRR